MAMVRKCAKCGHIDDRTTWASADEASKDGSFEGWACPMCAWTDFELVDADQAPAQTGR